MLLLCRLVGFCDAGIRSALPVVFVAAVLFGCATTASVDLKSAAVRKVGVVSVAGMYLTQKNVGFTVFGNEDAVMDVSAWNLDETYVAIVAQSLQRKTSLDVRALHPKVDDLKPIYAPASSMHVAFDLNPNWAKVEAVFRDIAAVNEIDTLVVFAPVTSGDYFSSSNQILYGLGIYTLSRGERTFVPSLHLFTQVVVISGKSGKAIGHAPVSRAHPSVMGGPLQRGQPATAIDAKLARTPLNAMSDDQLRQVRALAREIYLTAAIDATTDMLFPPGR
jgi:hypothetical protein